MTAYQVVFHLNNPEPHLVNGVLLNIRNLLEDVGDSNVEVELVVNGSGVTAFQESDNPHAPYIERLHQRGVRFILCANSLRAHGMDPTNLLSQVTIVPAGVSELVKRQVAGWAYIRA